MSGNTRRLHTRKYYESPVLYKKAGQANFHEAVMYNSSVDGLYFESDYALMPGTELSIKIVDKTSKIFGAIAGDTYRVIVRWCQDRAIYNEYCFGVGVQRKWKKELPMINLDSDTYSWSTVRM